MRSFEIFVEHHDSSTTDPRSRRSTPAAANDAALARPRLIKHEGASHNVRPKEVLDLFIHGANVTARVAERHASCVLRDLACALVDLLSVPRGKRIVRFYEDAWELCVERLGHTATLSVYRGGNEPTVLVYDRAVVFEEMCASVVDALEATITHHRASSTMFDELTSMHHSLIEARATAPEFNVDVPELAVVSVELDHDAPVSFAADFSMRPGVSGVADDELQPHVERADLHALLVRSRMRAQIRGRSLDLGEVYPFLFGERLLELTRRALEAWGRGQPFFERIDAGGAMVGLRMTAATEMPPASLTISRGLTGNEHKARKVATLATFPELSFFDVVEATLAFGRAFARGVLRRDRSQAGNLRLSAFRRDIRMTSDALREVQRQDTRINAAPESYRAFAHRVQQRATERNDSHSTFGQTSRLRYTERWRALVPGVDLRATFLCGDRLVIGATAETYCLDRTTGALLWRHKTARAASVVTPAGIARIQADGQIALHDFATGEVSLRTWLSPRKTGPCAGAVVNTAGLPRLLIVTEGDKHLVGIDLTSGEARWRYTWCQSHDLGRTGTLRLKRIGKLLYVASASTALTAVDVQTGAIVWRLRDRLRFLTTPTVDHETLFAIAGGANSAAVLHAIDPYSGHTHWSAALPSSTCSVEGSPLLTPTTVTVALRDWRGLRLSAFDRETGKPRFDTPAPVAPIGTSWLAVDDVLVGNTPAGDLVGIDGSLGSLRWRQTLGRSLDSDAPRKLEPVLRSGALFVPHTDVQVFRPGDGTHLGTVGPCDAIPDLLRVDERCDVYVAEESGHVASFGAGPRLSLVK